MGRKVSGAVREAGEGSERKRKGALEMKTGAVVFIKKGEQKKKLPKGVKIIGIYHKWFGGILGFFSSLAYLFELFFPNFLPQFIGRMPQHGENIFYVKIYCILSLILSPICYILGSQLLQFKEKGRKGILYLTVFYIFLTPWLNVLAYNIKSPSRIILSVLLQSLVICYLSRPNVKAQFQ